MRLRRHPDTSSPVEHVVAQVARFENGRVTISFEVEDLAKAVRWPEPAQPARVDRLWEHTCFELFVKPLGRESYYEFNFSPSGEWAAYRFSRYRTDMQLAHGLAVPTLRPKSAGIAVSLDLGQAPGLPEEDDWSAAICAVIEDKAGGTSYWALKHAAGKPDFHHADCFDLILAAPLRA